MEKQLKLSDLRPGERGRVIALTADGPMRRRFLELGLVGGTEVACVGQSPFGDPRAYEICRAVIAIRRRDAAGVRIERVLERRGQA